MSDSISYKNPSVIYIPQDNEEVRRFLRYRDKSVEFQIHRLKKQQIYMKSDWISKQIDKLKTEVNKEALWVDEDGAICSYSGLAQDLSERFGWPIEPYPAEWEKEGRLIPWKKVPENELWKHQQESLDLCLKVRHGAISLPTGSGKSSIILNLCKQRGVKTLVTAPSKEIAKALYNDFKKYFGEKFVGMYGTGKKKADKLFTISVAQALVRVEPGSEEFEELSKNQMFIFDECVPSESKVHTKEYGWISISKIHNLLQSGKYVSVESLNEISGNFEFKKVTKSWKNSPKEMYKITSDATMIATGNHPVLKYDPKLSIFKWEKVENISVGDAIRSNHGAILPNSDQFQYIIGSFLGDGHIQSLDNGKIRLKVIHGEKQKEYLEFGAKLFASKVQAIENNGFSQKKAYRFTTKSIYMGKDRFFPKKKGDCPDWILDLMDERAMAVWLQDDASFFIKDGIVTGATIYTSSFSKKAVEKISCSINRKFGIESHPRLDEGKYWNISIPMHSSNRLLNICSKFFNKSMAYKSNIEVGSYTWTVPELNSFVMPVKKIEKISKLSTSSRDKYKDDLYDIEVEGNHNFLVSMGRRKKNKSYKKYAFVVHNCHQAPADTFERVCMGVAKNCAYRYFFSATHVRPDGSGIILKGITGPVIYTETFENLVKAKILAEPVWRVFSVPTHTAASFSDAKKETRENLYKNPNVNKLAAEIANKAVTIAKRPTVIIIQEFAQMAKLYPHIKVPFMFAHGGVTKEHMETEVGSLPEHVLNTKAEDAITAFNSGKIDMIIGTSAIATGVDLKRTQCLIYLQGGTSPIKYKQAIGRGTRMYPGKNDCWFVDFIVSGSKLLTKHAKVRMGMSEELMGKVQVVGEYEDAK